MEVITNKLGGGELWVLLLMSGTGRNGREIGFILAKCMGLQINWVKGGAGSRGLELATKLQGGCRTRLLNHSVQAPLQPSL